MYKFFAVLVFLGMVAFAGCGGGSSPAPSPTPFPTPTPTPTPTPNPTPTPTPTPRVVSIQTTATTLRADGQSLTVVSFTSTGVIATDQFCYNGAVTVICSTFGPGSFANFTFAFPFDDGGYRPRRLDPFIKSADGTVTSNVLHLAFTGDKNVGGFFPGNSSGPAYLAFLDQANGAPSPPNHNGFVDIFAPVAAPATLTPNATWFTGTLRHQIGVDSQTGFISIGPIVNKSDGSPAPVTPTGFDNATVVDTASLVGKTCYSQPGHSAGPSISCFDLTMSSPPVQSVLVGVSPTSLDMTSACGAELDVLTFDRRGGSSPELFRHVVAGMTLRDFVLLGFPQASTLGSPVGAWDVKAFQGTCKIGVMGTTNAGVSLALVAGTPLAQSGSLIVLPATSYRLATDETHNRFLVAWFDATTGLTKFVTVNASTGAVANLTATTTFVAALLRVSTDGTTIQACGADTTLTGFPVKCQMIANN